MRIVVAGIKRSASTVQYNLVRIALELAGYTVEGYGQSYKPSTPVKQGHVHLIKIHPFRKRIADVADHIFLTDRKDEQILASLDRMWDSGNPERLEGMRKNLNKWKEYTDQLHMFHYSLWEASELAYSMMICFALGVESDPHEVLDKFHQIELPTDKQDPVTLFFPGHITSE